MPANRLLPLQSSVDRGDGSRVLGIREEAADEVFEALSSRTAREILAALYEDPDTASSLADRVDTSLQNATYHLENLSDADLVEVADTWYSEQGREMKVYAPASESLVVFAADESSKPSLKQRLLRVLGAVGVLGVASVVVQRLFGSETSASQYSVSGGGDAVETTTETSSDVSLMSQDAETTTVAAESTAQALPPGLLFFAGGLLVLTLALGYVWYRRR
jgi:DNA-binding transcriptional ArsR family regulator